jgi:hypothetical protein
MLKSKLAIFDRPARLLGQKIHLFDKVAFKDYESSLALQPHQFEMYIDRVSERDVFNRQAASSPQKRL